MSWKITSSGEKSNLVESTLVPVFLQELLLTLGLVRSRFLRPLQILPQSFFLGHRPSSLNLLHLLLALNFSLPVPLYPSKLPQPPCIKFRPRI